MAGADREQVVLATAVSERLDGALGAIDRERDVLDSEIDAFGTFETRLASISTEKSTPATTRPAPGGSLADRSSRRPAGASIREAYVETVMNVPHYEREYGESYWESLAAELGEELAVALGQSATFSPLLKDQLRTTVRESIQSRKRMRTLLEQEADAIREAKRELRAVVEELEAIRSRPLGRCPREERRRLRADLDELSRRCDRLSQRRQDGDLGPDYFSLRDGTEMSVNEYLYQSLPSQYPVLSAVATTVDVVVAIRRRLDRESCSGASTRSTPLE